MATAASLYTQKPDADAGIAWCSPPVTLTACSARPSHTASAESTDPCTTRAEASCMSGNTGSSDVPRPCSGRRGPVRGRPVHGRHVGGLVDGLQELVRGGLRADELDVVAHQQAQRLGQPDREVQPLRRHRVAVAEVVREHLARPDHAHGCRRRHGLTVAPEAADVDPSGLHLSRAPRLPVGSKRVPGTCQSCLDRRAPGRWREV